MMVRKYPRSETHKWSFETEERESRDQVTEAWVWLEGESQPSKMSPGRTRRQAWRVSAVELMFSGEALESRSYSCRGEGEGEEAAGTKYGSSSCGAVLHVSLAKAATLGGGAGRPHVTSEACETDLSLNTLTLTPGTFITVQTPLQHSPSLVFVLIPAGGSSGRSPCTSTQPSPSPPPPRLLGLSATTPALLSVLVSLSLSSGRNSPRDWLFVAHARSTPCRARQSQILSRVGGVDTRAGVCCARKREWETY
ncbi:hypothetical protein E2C01_014043 [Portunus trituberculatus]|uniref:Uncharacterized protein n=1 Tax=Portunus trituberculatus TaxID=210409 RepID=A0A5B7DI54_PORTR|nr:hypothetical protein [Portunus trituberculatus]